jgi:hypothetical protein
MTERQLFYPSHNLRRRCPWHSYTVYSLRHDDLDNRAALTSLRCNGWLQQIEETVTAKVR